MLDLFFMNHKTNYEKENITVCYKQMHLSAGFLYFSINDCTALKGKIHVQFE